MPPVRSFVLLLMPNSCLINRDCSKILLEIKTGAAFNPESKQQRSKFSRLPGVPRPTLLPNRPLSIVRSLLQHGS